MIFTNDECSACKGLNKSMPLLCPINISSQYFLKTICNFLFQEALVANLPETVLTVFQNAIDSANKGLVNWMFRHRGMKLLTVLSIPYTLPADIVYATLTK